MRRRQLYAAREREIMEATKKEKELQMSIDVPNSNIISKSAQPALKQKANMFLPHEKDIKLPNGKPAAKKKGR